MTGHAHCLYRRTGRSIFTLLAVCLMTFCTLAAPVPAGATKAMYSRDFQALLNEVQRMYIGPQGGRLDVWERQRPRDVAMLVGHALRQQSLHVRNNPPLQGPYNNLVQEARAYISRVESMNRTAPNSLLGVMTRALNGGDDYQVYSRYRVKVGSMPAVFAAGQSGPGGPDYDLPVREKKQGEQIDLLNIQPSKKPEEAKATYNRGVDYWNSGSRAWNAGNKDAAETNYRTAAAYWKKACELGWADGCRGSYGLNYGQYLRYWGQ